jgi:HAD superfamily hydrolase (TIGR01490 family)
MNLALFDFDGTLTISDSFIEFIKFYKGKTRFRTGFILLSPFLVLYKLKLLENWRVKEMVLRYFFKDNLEKEFEDKCRSFSEEVMPNIIRKEALGTLLQHKHNNDRVIVISASAEDWVRPWTEKIGAELIGTKLEKQNGKLTGNLFGKNCYGSEKVNRLKQYTDISEYSEISVYGDSRGDKELLNLGTKKFYKPFS